MADMLIKELSDDELEIYSRQIVLTDIGYEGQLKLLNAKVCLVGLGGLGCPAALQLAAMGIGYLRIIDRDVIERSNLQRQTLYDINSLYYPKVEIAAKKLSQLNPNIKIDPIPASLNADNSEEMIKGMDVVVDGLDAIEPRYALNWACVKHKVPYVFGAAIEAYGNVSTIIPGETPCLECFSGGLTDEMLPTCGVVGVHPSLPSIISSLEVSEAVRIILGKRPHLLNSLLYCDLRNFSFEKIKIARRENCQVCGSNSKLTVKRKFLEEICGRSGKKTHVINPRRNLDLSMDDLYSLIKDKGLNVRVKANLGITFDYSPKITLSALKSGTMIIEGASDKEQAMNLYKEIIAKGLKIPWSNID
ncbi:MAG: HesA/MoeB/ThiF family protein [archaeon]|nr:HesA/MoeB/ThiF family protein [archaeon]MCP8319600.1 HesA/MoeB/ThiF family protein [archaeon]